MRPIPIFRPLPWRCLLKYGSCCCSACQTTCATTVATIAQNKKAFHDYFIEERYEAGLVLQGWEVKSIRAGRANLKEAYVIVKGEEVYLIGAHMSPLPTVSTHVTPDPV